MKLWWAVALFATGVLATSAAAAPPCGRGPCISKVPPPRANVGIRVDVEGSHFGTTRARSRITIGRTPIEAESWSDTHLTFTLTTVPPDGPLVVTVDGVPSNRVPFAYSPGIRAAVPAVRTSPEEMALIMGEPRRLVMVDEAATATHLSATHPAFATIRPREDSTS